MPDDRRPLEDEIRRLSRGLEALEERVSQLEHVEGGPVAPVAPAPVAPSPEDTEDALPSPEVVLAGLSRSIQYIGRLFLVLGGAYLLRSLTEGGGVPPEIGVALGLFYGLVWIAFAARAAHRQGTYAAAWHGIAAAMITLPLIWETSARYEIVPPEMSAVMLAASALLALGVAWRFRLAGLAWLFVGGAGACALVLLVAGKGPGAPFALALAIVGGSALWAGRSRGWPGLVFVSALCADLAVLVFVGRTLAGEGSAPLHALAVPLLLFVVYAGSISVYVLRGWWRLDLFDVAQTAIVLVLGFGEALHIARGIPGAAVPLAIAMLMLAVGLYFAAFTVLDRERRRCFYYLTSIALVLVLVGSTSLLASPALPWTLLAVGTALVGRRFGRVSLTLHTTLYISAAVIASGLLEHAADGWLGAAVSGAAVPGAVAWLVFASLVICAALPARGAVTVGGIVRRVPHFLTLLLLTWTVGGLLLWAADSLVTSPAWLASARTALIVLLALGAAGLARWPRFQTARYLVYPLLGVGALKLLLEDLPAGVPASLAVSFLTYGAGLTIAHRLARGAAGTATTSPAPEAEETAPREP